MAPRPDQERHGGFVARREMGRSTGYWWAPDEEHITFPRVAKPGQSHPALRIPPTICNLCSALPRAGGANSRSALMTNSTAVDHLALNLGARRTADLAPGIWLPDGKTIAIHASRDQRRLDLFFADIATARLASFVNEKQRSWMSFPRRTELFEQTREFVVCLGP